MRDDLRTVLRAAAIAGFTVGVLLMFLHPPSLSGAWGLLSLVVASLAFLLIVAWGTVALMGGDGMSEEDFERLVRRSEELAREPALARAASEFDVLVADAIDRLPPDFQALLANTSVVVSRHGAEAHAYGHYFGDTVARGYYEDRIVLYQDTLERDFGHDPELLAAQVERTLRHELAHHLGWGEAGVRGLGL
jgi:predicted Zn-dependent protease with MMP-like domain